jgi:hypothetical protein
MKQYGVKCQMQVLLAIDIHAYNFQSSTSSITPWNGIGEFTGLSINKEGIREANDRGAWFDDDLPPKIVPPFMLDSTAELGKV